MNFVKKIVRNSLWLLGAQAGGRLFGVAVTLVLARHLGIEDFGRYSLIYAFCGIFGILTDIGIDTILVREATRDPQRASLLMGNGMALKAVFSLLAVGAAGGLARGLGVPGESVRLILLASLSFLASPLTLYNARFQTQLRMGCPALFNLAGRALALLFVLLALRLGGGLGSVVLALLGATLAQGLLTWRVARRHFRPAFRIDRGLCRRLVSQAWPLALNNLVLVLILRVDQIMLERLCADGDRQLGLYSAAVRYCELFHMLPAVYFASVFPLLARLTERADGAFDTLITRSVKYLTLAITPVIVFSAANASGIMSLLFGEMFSGAGGPMRVLIASELFVFLTWVLVNAAVSTGNQRAVPALSLASLAANVGLNLWLLPRHGALGAAVASLVSYGLVLPLAAAARPLRPVAWAFVRTAAGPCAGALLLGFLATRLPPGLWVSGIAVFGGFPLLMVLLGVLGREDLRLLAQAFRRGG